MTNCARCAKRFTVTSWTRSEKWRGVCPACIVLMLEKLLGLDPEEAAKFQKG